MLPGIHRATQKFYIFLLVYLTGRTPDSSGSVFCMQLQNSPSARLRAWRIKQREYKTKIKEHELEKHANQNHRKTTEFHEFSLVRGVTLLSRTMYERIKPM